MPDLTREAEEPALPESETEEEPALLEGDPGTAGDLLLEEQVAEIEPESELPGENETEPGDDGSARGVEEYDPAAGFPERGNGLLLIKDGDDLLALVTKETALSADYVPKDLRPIPAYLNTRYAMQLREPALESLTELWHAAEKDGVILHILSAYRSYVTQEGLFNNFAATYGEAEANRFSAHPGQSEHQLGTTVDFGGTGADLSAGFAQTPQGMWLAENAYRYGFAMSYMEGKEHITGYIYEPWHYRYIGIAAAQEWKQSGLTLKEYLKEKPQRFIED